MVETLRSLEMEREVGGRLEEGELAVLKVENQGSPGLGASVNIRHGLPCKRGGG